MAGGVYVLTNSKLWLDGFAFAGSDSVALPPGYVNKITLGEGGSLKEHTRFGDSGRRRLAGLLNPQLRMDGFWAADEVGATNEPDKPLYDRHKASFSEVPVSVVPETGAEGEVAYFFLAQLGRYEIGAPLDEVLAFNVVAEGGASGTGLLQGSVIGNKNVAAGGPTNGTIFQLGTVPLGKTLYAALHVLAVTTSVDVKIASDDNGGFASPVDRITFAQKTTIGSQFMSLAGSFGADDRYRITYSTVGGAPNARFAVVMAIR
jgi:hypothetical protein